MDPGAAEQRNVTLNKFILATAEMQWSFKINTDGFEWLTSRASYD